MATHVESTITNITDMNVGETLRKNWQWLLGLGIALVTLGTVSIIVAALTTLISVMTFGVFLLINSGMLIYKTIRIYWRRWSKFFLQLGIGLLYALAGIMFITFPLHGAISLTLLIAMFYIMLGIYRGVLAVAHRTSGWGWMLFSFLITLALGIFILVSWPAVSLWVIGVFVGIDIIFVGWAFIMSALSARSSQG